MNPFHLTHVNGKRLRQPAIAVASISTANP